MFWTVVDSPIDPLLLVGDESGLRELAMAPHSPSKRGWQEPAFDAIAAVTRDQLERRHAA